MLFYYAVKYITCVLNCLDAVSDALGRKTDVHLLKILQTEIKPSRHEARVIVC